VCTSVSIRQDEMCPLLMCSPISVRENGPSSKTSSSLTTRGCRIIWCVCNSRVAMRTKLCFLAKLHSSSTFRGGGGGGSHGQGRGQRWEWWIRMCTRMRRRS